LLSTLRIKKDSTETKYFAIDCHVQFYENPKQTFLERGQIKCLNMANKSHQKPILNKKKIII
jgi:hypothetical protein